jgi:hypothetical protein
MGEQMVHLLLSPKAAAVLDRSIQQGIEGSKERDILEAILMDISDQVQRESKPKKKVRKGK